MLFIIALCAIYQLRQWKQLLVLITAFTIGHSITLALATLNLVTIDSDLVEFMIPITIFLTSIVNIIPMVQYKKNISEQRGEWAVKYGLALGFGLIHGLGFSNFLRAMLGAEDSLFVPLLAFNLGLEAGQLVILIAILIVSTILVRWIGLAQRDWGLILSGGTAGASLLMIIEALIG